MQKIRKLELCFSGANQLGRRRLICLGTVEILSSRTPNLVAGPLAIDEELSWLSYEWLADSIQCVVNNGERIQCSRRNVVIPLRDSHGELALPCSY